MRGRTFITVSLFPIVMLLFILSVIPILYNIYISTTNMSLFHYTDYEFVGLRNYVTLISSPVTDFFRVASWNIIYSLLCMTLPFIIGVATAQSLTNVPRPVSAVAKPILVLPWVIPAFITILIWKGFFNYNFGAINVSLTSFGFPKVPWLIDENIAKISVILVSVWLGIPFMTVTASGVLKTIPSGVFEAAHLDGAGPINTFISFTLPLTFRRMIPVLVMGFAASFNNFTAIYLLTSGGPSHIGSIGGAGATDIIISYIFKLTLTNRRYGLAAAYAVVIFFAIGIFTLYNLWWIKRGREETF